MNNPDSQKKSNLKYRPDIDGLRAIAVLSVIFFHLKLTNFQGGFLGVDVFLVISGFLITSLLLIEAKETETISFSSFYARRMKRLLPAVIFLMLLTTGFWILFFFKLNDETSKYLQSVRYGIFGFANIFFKKNIGNYFDASSDQMPLLHLWSLGVEEQFYFIWPLLILAVRYFSKKKFEYNLFLTLLILSLVSFGASLWHIYTGHQIRAFYSMQFRAWELGIGSLIAIVLNNKKNYFDFGILYKNIFSLLGFCLIIFSVMYYSENTYFPGWRALFPTIGTAIFILFSTKETLIHRVLSLKIFVWIGLISYGVYLFHYPLIAFFNVYSLGKLMSSSQKIMVVAISFILSIFSYFILEKPVKHSLFLKNISNKKVIGIGFASCLFIFAVSQLIDWRHQKLLKTEPLKSFYFQMNERPNYPKGCYGSITQFSYQHCVLNFSKINVKDQEKHFVLIWGDSIAWATANLLDDYLLDHANISVVALSNFGHPYPIPPLLGLKQLWVHKNWAKEANEINANIISQIKEMVTREKNVSIVLEAFWSGHLGTFDKNGNQSHAIQELQERISYTLETLSKIGVKKILIFLPFPSYDYNISQCVQIHGEESCYINKAETLEKNKLLIVALKKAVSRFSNTKLINTLPFLCSDEIRCFSFIKDDKNNKIPTVWDTIHPSSAVTRFIGRKIVKDIEWLVTK